MSSVKKLSLKEFVARCVVENVRQPVRGEDLGFRKLSGLVGAAETATGELLLIS